MEKQNEKPEREEETGGTEPQHQPPNVSPMEPVNIEAYGGGMYGKEPGRQPDKPREPPASQTQSADGEAEPGPPPSHKPPPSTGDRDLDITGQSYIQ